MEEQITSLTAMLDNQQDNHSESQITVVDKSNEDIHQYTSSLTPSTMVSDVEVSLPAIPSVGSFVLSDNTSVIFAEEINQRREALILFSSQQSMATGRSLTALHSLAALTNNNTPTTFELTPFSSTISSLTPLCRICQCPAEADSALITPCRCDGSLKHIHTTCLIRWLDISNRRHKRVGRASFCELCGYIYRRHKHVKYRDWRWPKVSLRDRVLHLVFAISLFVMIGCAVATVLCFITDNEQNKRGESDDSQLTKEEIITICCGITFFVSFFISMSAEIKAKRTIHQIMKKCFKHNTVWYIENYNIANDQEYKLASIRGR